MKPETNAKAVDRRGFLKSVGGAGVAGAAAAVGASAPAEAAESDAEKKKARYRETDHVKAYYRTNRY
jgi:anaerobic selenocysteine-containing dehydrogenase